MRVLMLAQALPFLPTHDRARLAPASLLAHLAGRHAVTVVAPEGPGETPAQRGWLAGAGAGAVRVAAGRWRHPLTGTPAEGLAAMGRAARQAIAEWQPDLVHLEGMALAPLAAELPRPVVLSCGESGVRRAREARRLAHGPREWARAQVEERQAIDWERRWPPAAAACVVASELDRRTLAERVPYDRIEVIPPGIDPRRHELRRGGERARLVFAGHLGRPAHRAAAHRLATRVLPRVRRAVPGAELLVTGAGPRGTLRALAALPGVRVAGAAPDLRPSLWSGAVTLVPAEAGPAVEAAILESMAVGTPVVADARCLSGLDHLLAGHHLLLAESDAETAEAAVLLLREPVVAATLAANARQVVERRYTWAAVARAWEALWARTAETLAPAAAA